MFQQTVTRTRNLFLALSVLLAVSGCGVGEASVSVAEPASVPVTVVTAPARRGDAMALHQGTVNLEADSEAGVVAKVGGEILETLVEEGDTVKAGQVLARLDGDRLRLQRDRALADLNKLKQEYKRNVALHDRGLVSEGAFENLRFELDALDAAYRLARLELSYTEIRAPIAGVISERLARTGNNAMSGETLFRISHPGSLVAYLYVPQKDLFQFEVGQPAQLMPDALPDTAFAGRVARISPAIDPGTGTFRVTLEVDDPDGELRAGMFARVQIVYDVRSDAILIPAEAVLEEDAETAIFVVEEGTARRRVVGTGFSSDDTVEVLSGLEESEEVIVVGQHGLKDGTPVIGHGSGHQI